LSKRGTLRYTEEAFAEQQAKRARFRSTDGGACATRDAGAKRLPVVRCGELGNSKPRGDVPTPVSNAAVASRAVQSAPSTIFATLCQAHGLPEPVPEYRFHPIRKWRADYAFLEREPRVLVEIDGGAWTQGRHTRGAGFIEDQRKTNAAALLGFVVLRYTPDRLLEAVNDLRVLWAVA
jgi:very-short-patch-repair endonuclease